MEKHIKYKKYKRLILILYVLCFVLSPLSFGLGLLLNAYAEEAEYTSALEDLQKDSKFNIDEYPDKADDYSIQVIQLAESSNNELFIYTYQPSQKTTPFTATDINMSLSEIIDGTDLYGLTLLNTDGVFCKYKVNDYTVSDKPVRYYNITSIYRPWQNGIDEETGNDNTIDEVVFDVSQLWTVVGLDSEISYYCTKTETVTITEKYNDFLRYSNGWNLAPFKTSCDSHYVAFSTNMDIEYLYDATVSYFTQLYVAGKPVSAEESSQGGEHKHTVNLTDVETASNKADGWFAEKHTWKRIESIAAFKKENENDLTTEAKKGLNGKQWILRFAETEVNYWGGAASDVVQSYTKVTAVTILELHFKSNGIVYNLGVVDNKQSGDDKPGNVQDNDPLQWLKDILNWIKDNWYWLVIGAVGILALIVLAPFLPSIAIAIGNFLLLLLKGLWWLITLPFRGIAALVGLIKSKKDGVS